MGHVESELLTDLAILAPNLEHIHISEIPWWTVEEQTRFTERVALNCKNLKIFDVRLSAVFSEHISFASEKLEEIKINFPVFEDLIEFLDRHKTIQRVGFQEHISYPSFYPITHIASIPHIKCLKIMNSNKFISHRELFSSMRKHGVYFERIEFSGEIEDTVVFFGKLTDKSFDLPDEIIRKNKIQKDPEGRRKQNRVLAWNNKWFSTISPAEAFEIEL